MDHLPTPLETAPLRVKFISRYGKTMFTERLGVQGVLDPKYAGPKDRKRLWYGYVQLYAGANSDPDWLYYGRRSEKLNTGFALPGRQFDRTVASGSAAAQRQDKGKAMLSMMSVPSRSIVGKYQNAFHGDPQIDAHNRVLDQFVQEWAYFGLLRQCLYTRNVQMHFRDFVDNTGYVTTAPLQRLVAEWAGNGAETRTNDEYKRSQAFVEVRDYLVRALEVMLALRKSLELPENAAAAADRDRQSLFLSVLVLFSAIVSMLKGSKSQVDSEPPFDRINRLMTELCTYPLDQYYTQILANGWCPNRLSNLPQQDPNLLHYLSQKIPYSARQRYDDCSVAECKRLIVDVPTYRQQHFGNCPGNCRILVANTPDSRIINGDQVPVLLLGAPLRADHASTLTYQSANTVEYIAISHVWAEGLGCADANALPACQLERLTTYCRSLCRQLGMDLERSNNVALWIDTLCIPVGPPALRKNAVTRIREAFSSAIAVLVIDNQLVGGTIDRLDDFLVRFATSAWLRRLWTLQEGLTKSAHHLYLQTKTGPITLDQIRGHVSAHDEELQSRQFWQTLHTAGRSFIETQDLLATRASGAYATWPRKFSSAFICRIRLELSTRSTTKAGDEALCLANLLGLEPWQIRQIMHDSNATSEQRMSSLFLLLSEVPIELLFMDGPRCQVRGFGWAPKSLLSGSTESDDWVMDRSFRWYLSMDNGSLGPSPLCNPAGLRMSAQYLKLEFSPAHRASFASRTDPLSLAMYQDDSYTGRPTLYSVQLAGHIPETKLHATRSQTFVTIHCNRGDGAHAVALLRAQGGQTADGDRQAEFVCKMLIAPYPRHAEHQAVVVPDRFTRLFWDLPKGVDDLLLQSMPTDVKRGTTIRASLQPETRWCIV